MIIPWPDPIGIDNTSSSLRSVTPDMDEVAIAGVRRVSVDAVQRTQAMHTFGAFAPLEDLEGKLGLTPEGIADAARGVPGRGAAA